MPQQYSPPPGMLQGLQQTMRQDGSQKGLGFFGALTRPDNNVSTELSFDFDANGRKIFAPLIVPTLSKAELDYLLSGAEPTQSIYSKAIAHAMKRRGQNLSPFASPGEQMAPPQ